MSNELYWEGVIKSCTHGGRNSKREKKGLKEKKLL